MITAMQGKRVGWVFIAFSLLAFGCSGNSSGFRGSGGGSSAVSSGGTVASQGGTWDGGLEGGGGQAGATGAGGSQDGGTGGADGSTIADAGPSGDADTGTPRCLYLQPLNNSVAGCFSGECMALNADGLCPAGTLPAEQCPSGVGKPCGVIYGGQIPCCVPIPPGCDTSAASPSQGCDCFPVDVCGPVSTSGGFKRGAVCVSAVSEGGTIHCEQHGPA
jgi:hypothetical protein